MVTLLPREGGTRPGITPAGPSRTPACEVSGSLTRDAQNRAPDAVQRDVTMQRGVVPQADAVARLMKIEERVGRQVAQREAVHRRPRFGSCRVHLGELIGPPLPELLQESSVAAQKRHLSLSHTQHAGLAVNLDALGFRIRGEAQKTNANSTISVTVIARKAPRRTRKSTFPLLIASRS